jgi:D-threo-aldose 1-dehydrogenase
MGYNKLMKYDRIGLGTAPMGGLFGAVAERDAIDLIHLALDKGVNFFDTAPMYGAGTSERYLGLALKGVPRHSYTLQTKVGRLVKADGSVVFDFSRDGVLRSISDSLKRLGVDSIDNVLIHDPDREFGQAIYEAYPTLAQLRAQGVIKMVGAGMNQWEMMMDFAEIGDFDCFLMAGRYSLLQQTSLPFLQQCHQRGIKIWVGGAFNSGILATGSVPNAKYMYVNAPERVLTRVRQLEAICAKYAVPLHVAALQFVLANPGVTRLVAGALKAHEFAETLSACDVAVPAQLWHDLKSQKLIHHNAPIPV